jgi:hypothetical protein
MSLSRKKPVRIFTEDQLNTIMKRCPCCKTGKTLRHFTPGNRMAKGAYCVPCKKSANSKRSVKATQNAS